MVWNCAKSLTGGGKNHKNKSGIEIEATGCTSISIPGVTRAEKYSVTRKDQNGAFQKWKFAPVPFFMEYSLDGFQGKLFGFV